ncbi:UNVERIFIED_CONTAM: putative E3 ubiquitin-protein ligase LIN-1 [Sesamum calycinum]|uniref:RING-type E3 ubiquitin transferase n=1 Tax=Sesamum calycinum TaxID=2727403 RepID=A0AAW2PAN1_9LAMI
MAGNYRFEMEQNDIVRSVITTIDSFIQDRLIDEEQRAQHKEQCAERLAAGNGSPDKETEVGYSDQAVLANLDWGIDALEEALNTSNVETKMARLDYAEKMLQVCAMLNSGRKTAGVPNFYLSAWAHLNLSYLWKLRNNTHNSVLHILEMFNVDPFFSRVDFAPELWKSLFLPHMSSIVGWYSEERRRIVMDVIPDTSDLSFTVDFDQYFNESLILSVRPEQAERMQELEQAYGQSLDENTRLYAKYYKDCMNHDSATSRKAIPMLPIAEPPMTPLHEVSSRSIPDYVKFGPILPKSAGFSPVLKHKENTRNASSSKTTFTSENLENSAGWDASVEMPEECEDSGEDTDDRMEAKDRSPETVSNSFRAEKDDDTRSVVSSRSISRNKDEETTSSRQSIKVTTSKQSPQSSSPVDSPKAATNSRKMQNSMLRLLSARAMDSSISNSLPVSPLSSFDNSSFSSADSDGEMAGQLKTGRRSVGNRQRGQQEFPKSSPQGDDGNLSYVSSPTSEVLNTQSRPPKDFVCPITGQIFNDPVTLETGQTYERKAIQEWMNRGNTTCPITRQPLSAASLPKTNYVLKRLITSWKDQHPDLAQEFSCTETPRNCLSNTYLNDMPSESLLSQRSISNEVEHKPQRFTRSALSTSPTSVISQASIQTVINALKPYILCLCNSEDLQECEAAVLTIAKIWEDSNVDSGIHSYLSSPTIINGFMEVLPASLNKDVLRTTVYILSRLIYADDRVGDLLTTPKDAAIALLEEIVAGGDKTDRSYNARTIITENGIPALLNCLNRENVEHQILQMIKEEGTFSTMHTLLVYLQMSPMEQKPAVAFLLLQLDLLGRSHGGIVRSTSEKDFPSSQIMALRMLSSLSGHLGPSRKPYMESWLLKIAGFDQPYNAIMRGEETKTSDTEFAAMKEEEKATRTWEKRMAFVLTNHERGMIFKALEECFKSNSIEIAKSCLVVATWLVYMLHSFPDCGIRDVACKSLLDKFINVLQSSKNLEEKILAALALRGFISEPGGLQEMGLYAKSADLWSCVEGPELDVSINGEILSMMHIRNRLISSHSDGTIKVWDTGKSTPRLIQEAREHSKAVTCLYVPPACDKLYSGSLDKTIRVWSIKQEEIHCIQVHDVKEAVLALAANASFACFSTQGNGVKVYNWSGVPKSINFNKQVKCLAMDGEKLYCGCSGYSIQEVDLGTHTSSTFYSGAKRLLGKQTIYAVEIHNGLLYACGSSVDGIAGKVFKLSSKAVIGTLPAGLDIQQTTVNNDFIFTATKCGVIEVWLKDRLTKIAYVKTGSGNARITATASDAHGQKLFAGTSDGRLQVWSLD